MHYGEFSGKNAKNILILGESHHISTTDEKDKTAGVRASYSTAQCIIDYIAKPDEQNYRFFDKIVSSFGFSPDSQRQEFWDSVHFGNYINVLCGVGDSVAKRFINENKTEYNDELFAFVNEHNISKIYCFSVNVYENGLPSMAKGEESCKKDTIGRLNGKNVYLRHCLYRAGLEHSGTNVVLKNDLTVYGISHPSSQSGYSIEIMQKVLKGKINI
ncbi:MAG: hypothetical protein IKB08_01615 [Clostridia bacterium]|nr:hypothetical protein [Clostridia bacterium]